MNSRPVDQRSKPRRNLLVFVGIAMGILIGILMLLAIDPGWFLSRVTYKTNPDQPVVPEVNAEAPDFSLMSLSGEQVRLSDYRGQPVLINFWATWCGPCRLEMPLIQRYADRYPDELVVLTINDAEPADQVKTFIDGMGVSFPVLLDPNEDVFRLYRIRAFPTTMFVDRDGKIRYQHLGILTEAQLAGYLKELGISE